MSKQGINHITSKSSKLIPVKRGTTRTLGNIEHNKINAPKDPNADAVYNINLTSLLKV